ncbi:MAG: hypothetical protein ACRDDM_08205 [Paraclostridium sp.]
MPNNTSPDLSHLSSDEIVKILKENNSAEILKNRARISDFMEHVDTIKSLDESNVTKIAKLMRASHVATGDGGCGSISGGCC